MTPTGATSAAGPAKPRSGIKELTVRGIILGGLITLIFTAANVYLGLKVGLTFATSIPAAVISMAILRKFQDHSVQENNIVQTIASAAGTLGVMYSIPLRRALITGSDLPYPEGVAAAEVLKVGDDHADAEAQKENKVGLRVIIVGSLASAGYQFLSYLKVVAGSVKTVFPLFGGASTVATSLSLALIGVGHLVGLGVGIAMIVGLLISYGVLLPVFSADAMGSGDISEIVKTTFSQEVRFVGAGAMTVAAIWTLVKIIGPIIKGIKDSLASSQARKSGETVALTERDIPFNIVMGVILACMVPTGLLLYLFVQDSEISHHTTTLVILSVVFVLVTGLVVAAVCGYMAGLIGASNSPISGVGIIVVLASALLIKVVTGNEHETNAPALVAYTLFTAAVVFGIATISNDNLQDLKTGQLVDATPWRQQVALIIGVVFGSIVIPPVLQVMLQAFGFDGMAGAGPDALAAPQAALLSSVANGIFGNSLDWNIFGLGALIGVGVIIVDEILRKTTGGKRFLPPLAVGMGMYLPISLTLVIPIGAVLGVLYNKWADKHENSESLRRMGTLLATGLVVGESLLGVIYAAIIVAANKEEPLAIVDLGGVADGLGIVVFAAVCFGLYRWLRTSIAPKAQASKPAD